MPPNVIRNFSGNYAFLSNFYMPKNGKSVEHHYQAAKTNDVAQSARIMAAVTPREAKRLGRSVDLVDDWEDIKDAVMEVCLRYKFTNRPLAGGLIRTGEALLIEGNDWGDTYWGMCNGTGQNKLGIMLMRLRSELIIMRELKERT